LIGERLPRLWRGCKSRVFEGCAEDLHAALDRDLFGIEYEVVEQRIVPVDVVEEPDACGALTVCLAHDVTGCLVD
jgi:hypothetical protein